MDFASVVRVPSTRHYRVDFLKFRQDDVGRLIEDWKRMVRGIVVLMFMFFQGRVLEKEGLRVVMGSANKDREFSTAMNVFDL